MTEKNTSSRKLLSPEREERILAALGDGVRTIAELAAELQVSEATVRRDLQSLEQRALAMRVHGGAVRMQHGRVEPLFHEKTGRVEKVTGDAGYLLSLFHPCYCLRIFCIAGIF